MTISDGSGGTLTCWSDDRNGDYDVYVQRFNADGTVASGWPSGGLNVHPFPGDQKNPRIASDASGGMYVVWQASRHGTGQDIYMTRLTSSGNPGSGWCSTSLELTSASGDQAEPNIAMDGTGGALVAFHDANNIYAARITSTGTVSWSVSDPTSAGAPGRPEIVSDKSGGAIVVYRASGSLFGQRYAGTNGSAQWSGTETYPDVKPIVVSGSIAENPSAVRDGDNGVLVAYVLSGDVYLQHASSNGTTWGSALTICNASNAQYAVHATSDEAMGVIVTWADQRTNGDPYCDIYVQRIRYGSSYATCWTNNGVLVASSARADGTPTSVSDGAGGAYLAWEAAVRHIDNHGDLGTLWTLCPLSGGVQHHGSFAVTSDSTAILSWWDSRSSLEGIYLNQAPYTKSSMPSGLASLSVSGNGKTSQLVSWSEAANDATHGSPTAYILRRSTTSIAESTFDNATLVDVISATGGPYCYESMGLTSCTTYYYAVRTVYSCQVSQISNVDSEATNCSGGEVFCAGAYGSRQASPSAEETNLPRALNLTVRGANPASAQCSFEVAIPTALGESREELSVFDVSGRRVKAIHARFAEPGVHSISWDLRGDGGRPVMDGVYFVRLRVGGEELSRSLIVRH